MYKRNMTVRVAARRVGGKKDQICMQRSQIAASQTLTEWKQNNKAKITRQNLTRITQKPRHLGETIQGLTHLEHAPYSSQPTNVPMAGKLSRCDLTMLCSWIQLR